MGRPNQLRHVLNRYAKRLADLDRPTAGHEPRFSPTADGRMTNAKRRRKPSNPASLVDQGVDVHGGIVGPSDILCQPENVGLPDTAKLFLQHIYRMNEKRIIPPTPGARLKALRKERHLTQEDVAVEIGITRNYISEIETGKELPGRETLAAFADFYDVTVDYILKGDTTPPPSPMTPQFVEDPDELALLSYWKSLLPEERRLMIKLLFGR